MSDAFFSAQPPLDEMGDRIKGFPTWIEVELEAIGFNLEQVRERCGVEVIPCVKGDAYGHGLVPVVAYFMEQGVERVLVAKLWEANRSGKPDYSAASSTWIPCSRMSSTSK